MALKLRGDYRSIVISVSKQVLHHGLLDGIIPSWSTSDLALCLRDQKHRPRTYGENGGPCSDANVCWRSSPVKDPRTVVRSENQ